MSNILKNVDIDSLIVVNVYKGKPQVGDPNPFVVAVDPIDQTKKVVFDEGALKVLNARLTEKLKGADATNPNTVQYLKEFTTKMVVELYRNGLLEIVDIPDSPEDPYKEAKAAVRTRN